MELFKIFGRIALNGVDDVNRDLNETTDNAEGSSNKMVSAFKKLGGVIATVFAVDKIVGFGKACVEAAAAVAAEEAAFTQIMGDYSDQAQKKIEEIADATGITSSRMTPYMTSMTAKFKGLGYGTEEATTMAQDGLLLAADAAAFWDKSLDDSMGALNSFINGNYEGGEAIGLFANETALASWTSENLGMKWDKLSEKEKQFARLQFAKAMQEASGAAGQAAKESDAYANVQGNLNEAWRQFQAVIGEPILENLVIPAMIKLTDLLEYLGEKVENVIEWVSKNGDTMRKWGVIIASISSGVAAFLVVMNWGTIMSSASAALSLVTGAFKKLTTTMTANPLAMIIGLVAALIPYLVHLYQTNEEFAAIVDAAWSQVQAILQSVWAVISPILQQAWSWFTESLIPAIQAFISEFDLFGTATETGGTIFSTVMVIISEALTVLAGLWNTIWPVLQSVMSALFSTLQSVWTNIGQPVFNLLMSIVTALYDSWMIIWPSLQSLVSAAFTTIQTVWTSIGQPVFDLIKQVVNDVIGFVGQFFTDNFNTMGSTASDVLTTLSTGVATCFEAIASFWTNTLQPVLVAIGDFLSVTLKPVWDTVFGAIKTVVQNTFDGIIQLWNNSLKPIFDGIVQFISGVFTGDWSSAWEGIKTILEGAWNGIKIAATTAIENVSTVVQSVISALQTIWNNIWSAIRDKVMQIWESIKSTVTTAVSNIRDKVSSVFSSVKSTVTTVWTGIKTAISDKIEAAKEAVQTTVSNIRDKVSSVFSSVKSTVTTAWNAIKEAIQNPIEAAKTFVGDQIQKMRDFFNFEWSLPKLKLPHVTISGSFSLSPPSVPKFGIDWYAKGGILEAPTIFGVSPTTGKALAGGEAGPEAVAPIDVLLGYVRTAVQEQNAAHTQRIEDKFDDLMDVVREMLLALQAGQQIVLNNREVARTVREYA